MNKKKINIFLLTNTSLKSVSVILQKKRNPGGDPRKGGNNDDRFHGQVIILKKKKKNATSTKFVYVTLEDSDVMVF